MVMPERLWDDIAVWLYGSAARGNIDHLSDVDVLVITDHDVSRECLIPSLPKKYCYASVTNYKWSEIRGMASYGSLFLWHLFLEGNVIFEAEKVSRSLGRILHELPEYQYTDRDIVAFSHAISDVYASQEGPLASHNFIFDASVLATTLRHASILGCWLLSEPTFSRYEPFYKCASYFGFDDRIYRSFPDLYRYKLAVDSRCGYDSLHNINLEQWISIGSCFVMWLREVQNDGH